ncbi:MULTISPECIES: maleylpyruvate isomerase family mycothiol-dependent enzyme [unclassified Cryobacterium]|uniref:maleylpyruvate isomerase family mycothiol-dependent enzyme n=1 Tax=unclassified Cryobacterium TaxID=2649013 RepID=UPI002AB3E95D|nr:MULTISPECIES: maleylpyruvate isomerase family mycothiol-dependent enzyme [unclassified Cryobacterium]MDY7540998.1 maleylpyruvate isomerase family mycothiol-dependent enzyme [Cryobacterium sp. 5B3]MEA9998418.1 maleylpyruvate isomerase family mycothiol-dependent enzyme [Cryobacterium sp. RTS3]MEB0266965.1 maleylpyruvate isomerase family mycothiol-dependent enzyme [Cryobacterium sp. 10I5]MEB0273879.1 maleylpyruvate isomerase family mycothiol-dependent enzyme [Cryobacterium sp. 5B3]
MPDISQYLPFSRKPQVDDTGTTADWSAEIAAILTGIAGILETLSPDEWESPSLCGGWRVRDAAGHLVWRVGTPTRDLLGTGWTALRAQFPNPSVSHAVDSLSRRAAEAEPDELIASLRATAAEYAAGRVTARGRHGITELTEVVVHGLDLAYPLGKTLEVSSVALGAVAVRQALLAPTPVKAVVRRRTLVATDAGWRVGRGAVLDSTAVNIVLFLFGREGFTPTGPRSPVA